MAIHAYRHAYKCQSFFALTSSPPKTRCGDFRQFAFGLGTLQIVQRHVQSVMGVGGESGVGVLDGEVWLSVDDRLGLLDGLSGFGVKAGGWGDGRFAYSRTRECCISAWACACDSGTTNSIRVPSGVGCMCQYGTRSLMCVCIFAIGIPQALERFGESGDGLRLVLYACGFGPGGLITSTLATFDKLRSH